MRMARYETLMDRRPLLLSSVMLRQNPHNVHEWQKRAALFEASPAKVIHTYATAVKTVDPAKALGKPLGLTALLKRARRQLASRVQHSRGGAPSARWLAASTRCSPSWTRCRTPTSSRRRR